jgi:hypothetical protein
MVHGAPYRSLAKVSWLAKTQKRSMVHGAWCILYHDQKSIESHVTMTETGSEGRPKAG